MIGIDRNINSIPIAPPRIDLSRKGRIANAATTISPIAPKRSSHGARLKNSHHTKTSAPPPTIPTTSP